MYAFRIKYKTCKNSGINSDSHELIFKIKKYNCEIKLSADKSNSIKDTKYLYLSANSLSSSESAKIISDIVNDALTTTSALLDLGIDVPKYSPKSFSGKNFVEYMKNEGTILLDDNFDTTIYEYEEGQKIMYGSFSATPVILCNSDKFNDYFISCIEKGKIDNELLLVPFI